MSLQPADYISRISDAKLACALRAFGAVEVTGPKYCGKTWTSMAHGASIVHLDDDAVRRTVALEPSLALEGEHPHIIDEWQEVPATWDCVRRAIDESGNERGRYILTGSSTADRTKVSHSGAGRIARLAMRTMSLSESGDSDGKVSLAGLFEGRFDPHPTHTSLRRIAQLICRGGWPASLDVEPDLATELPAQYLSALFEISAQKARLNPFMARRIAVSLARNVGKAVTYKTLYADVSQGDEPESMSESAKRNALEPYLRFFQSQYFIEEQNGWDAPVKARSRVRTKPRRCFADPSLAASLLAMTSEHLLFEGQLLGNLFEEMCLRDLRVYSSALGHGSEPPVLYYADSDGLEVDAIIEAPDGRWGAIEIKLSDEKVPQAIRSLKRLEGKVASNPAARNPSPAFLAVLVGKAEFCYQTPEGVYVFPITSLTA